MTRRVGLLTFALVAVMAVPASAQVYKRDHRKKGKEEKVPARRGGKYKGAAPIEVTKWDPHSGPVGTSIRIDGKGFDRKTQVIFGGRAVRPRRVARNYLEVIVPQRWGDGVIVLRHPDMGKDLVVGTFEVIADPSVSTFSPAYGVPGTRVEIRGTGFRRGDQVLMNNRALAVNSIDDNRIVVTIPNWANTDYIVVSRPGGAQSRSRGKFRVDQPAPTITGVSPASGPVGTKVRISGTGFTSTDRVFYGRWPAKVVGTAGTWIDFEVPDRARHSQPLSVRGPYGEVRWAGPWGLEQPASIARYAPEWGPPGTRVELYGDNYQAGDEVYLAGRKLKVIQLRTRQISVEIPAAARTGKFSVRRGSKEWFASGDYQVAYPPEITGFTPDSGEPGIQVKLEGRYFVKDMDVYYGAQRLRIVKSSNVGIWVKLPNRATDDYFIVRGKGGEAKSPRPFRVHYYSTITRGPNPSSGPAGTRVDIFGRDFAKQDRFWIGGVETPVVAWSDRKVTIQIPQEARTGVLSWETYGRRQDTTWTFTVQVPPKFGNYGPHAGAYGTEIAINGKNFTPSTKVLWGDRPIRITRRELPNKLWAEIPEWASGSEYIWVEDYGVRDRSGKPFSILQAPDLNSYTPAWGSPGTEIQIAGARFTKDNKVRYGASTWLNVVRWTPTVLTVSVPPSTPAGADWLWVIDGSLETKSRTKFKVTGYAQIDRFSPGRGKPGSKVTIFGQGFNSASKIYFGKYEAAVERVDPRGRRIWVTLPNDANGKGYFWVEDNGNRGRSPDQFEVISSKSPYERVPSRRGVKKRRRRGR